MRNLMLSLLALLLCMSCKLSYAASDKSPVGHWKVVDFVKNQTDFKPGKKSFKGDLYLKEFVFKKDGKTHKPFWTWKENKVFHSGDKTEAKFVIKEIDGKEYLFLEWMSGDVTIRKQKPWLYVFER
ncbi:MAG: hypothetical protein ACYTFY_13050 [Planctomycetota bacterium]|jgi:hypothetical protein